MAYTALNSKTPDNLSTSEYNYPYQSTPPCNKATPVFSASRNFHSGGVNSLCGDGSVRFVKNSISLPTWRALSSPNGGEVISADSY